jgi:hypothetical protein
MCARRFLILILILTLIAVGGAFALYQWGSEVLIRMATPSGHYQEPPKGSGPDYSSDASWWAKPGKADDPSIWVPDGSTASTAPKSGATFYVHPTTYLERDRWNAAIDPGGLPANRIMIFVESQATAFNSVSEVWAPKYRQAAYGAFLLNSEDAHKALDLAYRDVLAAFDNFLNRIPPHEPIILAAHSQGSMHLLRLLADRKGALNGRLVAAYIVGWPVGVTSDLPATDLSACATASQAGCVLSWQSFKAPANTDLITDAWVGTTGLTGAERTRQDMLCVNPLTGTRDGVSPPTPRAGPMVPYNPPSTARIEHDPIGARCDKGFLTIEGDIPNLGPYVLPGNNYHVYDYALFWGSIRADAERRVGAWPKR